MVADKENWKEEAAYFDNEHVTRHKRQQKQRASMYQINLIGEWAIFNKVIELEENVPTVTTSITEEHQRQDIKQRQSLKIYP